MEIKFSRLIREFGDNDAQIAAGIGASRQLVAHWRKKGITKVRQVWIDAVLKRKKNDS